MTNNPKNNVQGPDRERYGLDSADPVYSTGIVNKGPENALQSVFMAEYESCHSWRKIGKDHGISGPAARRFALEGAAGPEVRERLGLPARVLAAVESVTGDIIPDGAQVSGPALLCVQCQARYFLPNHPRRRRCFVCSPRRTPKNGS